MEPEPTASVEVSGSKTVEQRMPDSSDDVWEEILKQERKTPRRAICPRGVYRFHSHEEADAWLEKYARVSVKGDQ